MSAKKGKAEAQRVAQIVKQYGVPFFCADCELGEDVEALNAAISSLGEILPGAGVLLLSAGLNSLIFGAHVPEDKTAQVSALDWVAAASNAVAGTAHEGGTVTAATGEKLGDKEKNEYPIKLLDIAKSGAFAYLRSKGAVQDDSDDDEPVFNEEW